MQASRSEISNSNWNYLNNLSNSLCLQQRYSFFFDLNRLTSSFENELKLLKLDDKEIALMLCLLIVSIGESNSLHKILFKYLLGLENSKFDEELFSILYDYMAGKFDFEDHFLSLFINLAKRGIDTKDYFLLTIRIPFLHRISKRISTYINSL